MPSRSLGRPLPRVEANEKVCGSCRYTADFSPPGMLWGKFLRSPYPHARILSIDASKARRLAGVLGVITGTDVSPRPEGYTLQDKPVFAQDRVRYIGEKVAGVAAIDKDIAEEALSLIDVEYEELPAVFEPFEAMAPQAPLLHENYATYIGPPNMARELKNVQTVVSAGKGDIELGFAQADRIFQNTFKTQMVHQGFIEPRACLVEIDSRERISVWFGHQSSFKVRKWLAVHLDMPEEMIIVHPTPMGGSFGGKEGYEEALCTYYLARSSRRPVKVVETYAEELLDGEPRHAAIVTLKTGVKGKKLWAWEGKIYYNGGAYAARKPSPRANMSGTTMLAGSYNIPHVRMNGYAVYTNRIPCGYFRAPGEVQTLFAVESHVDTIAEALGIDPLEFRLTNCLKKGDTRPTGEPISDPRAEEVLREVARASGRSAPSRKNGKKILFGRGIALGDRHVGHGESSAELRLEPDGKLRLLTSVRDQGAGAYTMHRQVAAEILGVEPEAISVEVKGTEDGPYDEGVRGARGAHVEGTAVARAASAFLEQARDKAAAISRCGVENIRWQDGKLRSLNGARTSLSLAGLARLSPTTVRGFGQYRAENKPHVYSFQALVADVAVDAETGEVRVLHLYFAYDVTRVINPVIHQGQIDGAIMQGVGFTLMEELAVEDGRIMALSLGDYKIPNFRDIPPLHTSLVKAEEGPGPFGVKAVAEAGISIVAPAIANAVYNATGVRITEPPLTAEKVLKGLREKME